MKSIFTTGLFIFIFAFFLLFVGCADDEQPENFGSLEDAQSALYESEEEVFTALYELSNITETATTFDGSYPDGLELRNQRSNKLSKIKSPTYFGYNSSTGFWTFDTSASYEDLTLSLNGKIRFTPRNALGLPDETTNTMEYKVKYSLNESAQGNSFEMNYNTDVNLTGIASFRAGTGNATLNGSTSVGFTIDGTYETTHITAVYKHAYRINDVILSPTSDYPQSGTFTFTVKRNINTTGYGSNFYVAGSITFNGTNIAVLEFGGYTFHINLDGMYIVEFD